jgi:hypothetical protein
MNTRTALGTCLVLTAILAGAVFLAHVATFVDDNISAYSEHTRRPDYERRHCCIEPGFAGEAQRSGGPPHRKAAKKDSNHSIVAMVCQV